MPLVHDTARAFMPFPEAPVPQAATGPLAGLSFAVKDLFDVAGYPTSGGQPFVLALSGIKTRTAPTVQTLLDAGARFVGKTITDELAFSMNGQNAHFGSPINGAAPDRITGGSSSGSAAAVSNRLCDMALGTDTGGSVRAPASHCGLYGLRPTHGRVSLKGALDLSPSFDTCGWFTRDLHSFARVADVLLGADPAPLPAAPRLLRPTDIWALVAPEVLEAFAAPCAKVEAALGLAAPTTVVLDSLDAMYWHYRHVQGHEAWTVDGALIARTTRRWARAWPSDSHGPRQIPDHKLAEGQAYRARFRAHMAALLGTDGVLLMPTMPDIAPLISDDEAGLEQLPQPRAPDAVRGRPGRIAAAQPAAGPRGWAPRWA
jgi:amidase